jgi:photosystem II stability/assembly factor-like uncharacterized protein
MNFLWLSLVLSVSGPVAIRNGHGTVVECVPKLIPGDGGARSFGCGSASNPGQDSGFTWRRLGTFANAVFTDLSFADDSVGYVSAELGQLYKTTNSGQSWTRIMNLGFPYYWYGVHALTRDRVIVSGFNNTSGAGIYRWTFDGGTTWDSIVPLDTGNWFGTVQFADSLHGIIVAAWNGGVWRTENGGRHPEDWSYVQVDPARGWYSGSFTFLPNRHGYVTGITFCHSRDAGLTWDVQHSVDPVFDGGLSFPDTLNGWTGGGQISNPVQGWIHRTSDGGLTWTDRLIVTSEPIRSLLFLNETLGFAVGGNLYSGVGAIYSTTNGGDSWRQDINTASEMKGIDWQPAGDSVDVWCAGFNGSFTGSIYKTRIGGLATGLAARGPVSEAPGGRLYPNPARGFVTLTGMPWREAVLYDAAGRRVKAWPAISGGQLDVSQVKPGWYLLDVRQGRASRRLPLTKAD